MRELLTPKQVARAIGVSESSLKRWCDRNLLPTVKTAGGHRRIALRDVMQFLRETGTPIVQPSVLGLPSTTGQGELIIQRQTKLMQNALLSADEEQCRRIVFDLYLAKHSAVEICDNVIATAFHNIGDAWACGDIDVYQERRACEICLNVLHELRSVLPKPPQAAPYALGGTMAGDVYRLPTTMVEIALREVGWQAQSYGNGLPAPSLATAIVEMNPRVVWVSASYIAEPDRFLVEYKTIYDTAVKRNIAVVVGGKALTESIRQQMEYSAFCDTLRHLVSFAATIYKAPAGTFVGRDLPKHAPRIRDREES